MYVYMLVFVWERGLGKPKKLPKTQIKSSYSASYSHIYISPHTNHNISFIYGEPSSSPKMYSQSIELDSTMNTNKKLCFSGSNFIQWLKPTSSPSPSPSSSSSSILTQQVNVDYNFSNTMNFLKFPLYNQQCHHQEKQDDGPIRCLPLLNKLMDRSKVDFCVCIYIYIYKWLRIKKVPIKLGCIRWKLPLVNPSISCSASMGWVTVA